MKVRFAETAAAPGLQIVMTAETDQERMLLRQFLSPQWKWNRDKVEFRILGYGKTGGGIGYDHFNCGWMKSPPFNWKDFFRNLFRLGR